MQENDVKLEQSVTDLTIERQNQPAQTIVQGVDGSVFCTARGQLYKKDPDGSQFYPFTKIDDAAAANILAFDNGGNMYYSGKGTGELKVSRDYGRTFSTCLIDGGKDSFRGFAIDNNGGIYLGSYAKQGPASLYFSGDEGSTWTSLKTFRCRHIHDVAINPENNWIYVVTGERYGAQKLDAYKIFRSKDYGEHWDVIFSASPKDATGWSRPLYLGIGFINNVVAVSTDHYEGNNGIDVFMDDGSAGPFKMRRVLTLPEETPKNDCEPAYCWSLLRWREQLYTIASGSNGATVYRSLTGLEWEKCAELEPYAGQKPEFYPYENKLLLSGHYACYVLQENSMPHNYSEIGEDIRLIWQKKLLEYDLRFYEHFCKGYYFRTFNNSDKQNIILQFFKDYNIEKNGVIVDVGCGVGPYMLRLGLAGYHRLIGTEANPRWLIAARRLYEATFPDGNAIFRLIPRGGYTLPVCDEPFAAVLIMGIFCDENHVPFDMALTGTHERLMKNGIICFNLYPPAFGEKSPDIFLRKLAEAGFSEIRCKPYKGQYFIAGRKH